MGAEAIYQVGAAVAEAMAGIGTAVLLVALAGMAAALLWILIRG